MIAKPPLAEKCRACHYVRMKKNTYITVGIVVLAVIIGTFLMITRKTGIVEITVPKAETVVFIDNKRKVTTSIDNEVVTLSVSAKEHSVLVANEKYFPWLKEIEVKENTSTPLRPFLVAKSPDVTVITDTDPERGKINSLVVAARLPRSTTKKQSQDGTVSIWAEGETIFAEWNGSESAMPLFFCPGGTCDKRLTVITLKSPIRNLDFYKDRNDVVIFAAEEGILALELDKTKVQNLQPIYKGNEPMFYKNSDQALFVKDGQALGRISF